MKIHQLPIGARFEFQGEEYVKTGPLLGTGKGGQRLIPKYAVLKVLGEAQAVPQAAGSAPLSRADVLAAFEIFCADCRALMAEDARPSLESARQRFLKTLD